MNVLARKAYLGLAKFAGVLAIALFASAGTLAYWQAWLYLANILGASVFITRSLSVNDPALLERRLQTPAAERRRTQRLIQLVASAGYVALHIVSALDRRFGWCPVATWLSLAAEVLVAWGFWVVFRVFEENSYSSSIIEIGENQRVVDTGPYARVRHPMYAGALVMLLATPPALGSLWGLAAFVPLAAALVLRIADEERFLVESLPGYGDYRERVRYRLIPFVW